MRTTGVVIAVALALAALPGRASAAANKEHQQLMAEIRMLQEQQQQLQQMLGGLADTLKTITTRMDAQAGNVQKAFADQNLLVNNISETVRILREKADDTNVRLSTMTQELDALRQTIASQPAPAPAVPVAPGGEPAPGEPGALPPTAPAAPAPTAPAPPLNISPQRMYDQAYADYTAGQFDLAIEGFQAFIRTFPNSPNADEAQLHIGNSLQAQSKYREALTAYQKVITDYPQGDSLAPAYYKVGLTYERLNQPDLARKAFETVIKDYPTAVEAALSRQRLDSMGKGKDD